MKRIILSVALALAAGTAGAQVGVSIGINQPGFYGQINIGGIPQPPPVVYQQPVIIQPVPAGPPVEPIYLHVPPAYVHNWKAHCREYGACGRPVYFVQEEWFNKEFMPRYGEKGAYYGNYPHHDEHWQGGDYHLHSPCEGDDAPQGGANIRQP
jgi:hypothetical protein